MIEIEVCVGSACHIRGAYNVVQVFQQMIEEKSLHGEVDFKTAFCMRECHNAGISVAVNGQKHLISPDEARVFFEKNIMEAIK
jgi:NADH:ubiquinone oxidoreductase subunit E